MIVKAGSAQPKYAGLLPVEPSDDFDLNREDVRFPNCQPSAGKRPRSLARVLIAFSTGVAITLLWQSPYGDTARERIANLYPQVGWFAARPPTAAENVIAPATPSTDPLNAMSFDLDAVGQNADNIAADQELTPPSTDQTATAREQMIRNTHQTPISVNEAPATEASNVTVESEGDAASLKPARRLTEARLPQTLTEKGRPLSGKSGHDGSCFGSASAVLQNHPGAWPTWTLKAPGREGTMCWYAAERPRGGDHRPRINDHRREIETAGTAENGLPTTGRGGSFEGGSP
jgi:hypothetical protein